jgi:O-antigen/teichoic acid export membrane protein
MARKWSLDYFGQYTTVFNYFQLLQQAPLLGLHFLLARDAAARPDRQGVELVTAGLLGLMSSIPIAISLVVISRLLYPSEMQIPFLLVGISLTPTALITVIEMIMTGQDRLTVVAVVNSIESALRFVTFGALIHLQTTPTQIFFMFLMIRLIALGLYMFDKATRELSQLQAFNRTMLYNYVWQAPVLFSLLILSTGFSRLDIIFLSKLTMVGNVAIYSVAARIYELAQMVPAVLMLALLPTLSRIANQSRDSVSQICFLALRYGVILGLPAAVLCSYAVRSMIIMIFGEPFAAAEGPTQVLLITTLVMGANQLMATMLLVFNLQWKDLQCLAVGVLALIIALLSLIPLLGLVGAAFAVLCGAMVQLLARLLIVRKIGIRVRTRDLFVPALAGGLMIATIHLANSAPMFAAAAGLLVYIAALGLSHIVSRDDLIAVRRLIAEAGKSPRIALENFECRTPAPYAGPKSERD